MRSISAIDCTTYMIKSKFKLFSLLILVSLHLPVCLYAQQGSTAVQKKVFNQYQDSLAKLGYQMINNPNEPERKNANYNFIRTLVSTLKADNSFNYNFDSLKTISVLKSSDNKFRIFSWFVMNDDGSYRFYGAIQMNSTKLLLHPLEDYSPLLKNPEDSVVDNRKWYGAEYYKIVPVAGPIPYYILLGWKGNTIKSTKKVIEVLSFKNSKPEFGRSIFQQSGKTIKRVVFQYSRQASMLLRHVSEKNLIVFDHLSAPNSKLKEQLETYGPDLTYDAYKLSNGKWQLQQNIDMRNVPSPADLDIPDPKQQALRDKASLPHRGN